MPLRLSLHFKNKYSFLTSKTLIEKTINENKCLLKKATPKNRNGL